MNAQEASAKGEKTKEQIFETATELFSKHGYNGVSTGDIAEAAGVNKALIFYYFTSKQELFKQVFHGQVENVVTTIRRQLSNAKPGLASIEEFIRAHMQQLRENAAFRQMMIRELVNSGEGLTQVLQSGANVALKSIRNDLLREFSIAKQNGEIRDVDPLQTIVNLISMDVFFFIGEPIVRLINPNIDINEFEEGREDNIIDLIINGMKKRPE
jgi:TetR/AcrR family transcriptional regulator